MNNTDRKNVSFQKTQCKGNIFHSLEYGCTVGASLILILVLLSFLIPLITVILNSVIHSATKMEEYSAQALLKMVVFTFEESLASTALALLAGLPASYLVAKKKFFGRTILLSFSAIPLCIPALIVALGYVTTFGMSGYANRLLMTIFSRSEPPVPFLYSFWGIVFTQGFYNFPLIMSTVADTWSSLPQEQVESARLLGTKESRVFRTITLYQLLPAIISACIPVFLYCFFSFMIVLLFGATGCTTLEVAVYHAARSTLDFSSAALYAVIETFAAFGMVFAYGLIENRASRSKGVLFNSEKLHRTSISKKEVLPTTIFLVIIILCFVIPLASIAVQSFTTRRLSSTPSFSFSPWIKLFSMTGFATAFATTLYTALIVSLLSTIAAFTYAVTLRIKDPFSQNTFLRTLPLLPMAVSSVVISLGMTFMVKRGTVFSLVLAQTALYWPFAFRQIYTPLSKMPDSVLDAANTLSPYRFDALFRICIPYSFKGIVSAIGFCFALSAGDATIPLVLAIPHFDTLALFTYRLAGSHRFSEACASGLILGILCAGIFTLSNKWKWKKI